MTSLEQKLRALAHEEASRLKLKQTKIDDKTANLKSKLSELQSELTRTSIEAGDLQRVQQRALEGYVVDTTAPYCPVCWAGVGLRLRLERRDPAAGIGWQCAKCHTVVEAD